LHLLAAGLVSLGATRLRHHSPRWAEHREPAGPVPIV